MIPASEEYAHRRTLSVTKAHIACSLPFDSDFQTLRSTSKLPLYPTMFYKPFQALGVTSKELCFCGSGILSYSPRAALRYSPARWSLHRHAEPSIVLA